MAEIDVHKVYRALIEQGSLTPEDFAPRLAKDIQNGKFEKKVIDTTNDYMVGVQGTYIVMGSYPRTHMGKDRALRLAAWLVALADPGDDEFREVLKAIRET